MWKNLILWIVFEDEERKLIGKRNYIEWRKVVHEGHNTRKEGRVNNMYHINTMDIMDVQFGRNILKDGSGR